MGRFDGWGALVTGGASGIGLATARRLADEGAGVAIVDLPSSDGKGAAEAVGGLFLPLDVGDSAAWAGVVATAVRELGNIRFAHLNAGVTTGNPDLEQLTDEQYRRIMGANVDGVVFGLRAVLPAIADAGGGAVVATASMAGLIAFQPDPIYTLTKHAVVGLVRSAAPALSSRRVTFNAVCPGVVDTPLVGEARAMLQEAKFPFIQPEEIADAVVLAATSGGTGQCWMCLPGRAPEPHEFPDLAGRLLG